MYRKQIKKRAQELYGENYSPKKIINILYEQFPEDLGFDDNLCEKTIRRWAKQPPVIIEVQKHLSRDILRAIKRHHEDMRNIAIMLVGEFDNVKKNITSKDKSDMYIRDGEKLSLDDLREELSYQLWKKIANDLKEEMSKDQLMKIDTEKTVNQIDYEYFLSHLQAEFPERRLRHNYEVIYEIMYNPYAFIEALRAFARKSYLRGTCEVCESWYQE